MPTNATGIKILMGGTGILRTKPAPELPTLLSTLQAHNINNIDTAVIYGPSEELLGDHSAGATFTLDTKIPGGFRPGSGSRDAVVKVGHESQAKLKVKQVDVLYIHAPEEDVSFEDTLAGLQDLYQEGMFRRLGLSNFTAEQFSEVFEIVEAKGWVKPSVFQGNYNAFARSYEKGLLPLLREKGVSFYAYSPQAGGFLSKTKELIEGADGKGEGRFLGNVTAADLYKAMYKKPKLLEGLRLWNEIAEGAGLKPGDMAVRWVRFNSALKKENGDGLIIGGRTIEQVEQTLSTLEQGPLSEDVVRKIDEVWEIVKDEAPTDNYHDIVQKTATGT